MDGDGTQGWQRALSALLPDSPPGDNQEWVPLQPGLQFDLRTDGAASTTVLRARPVAPGTTGRWRVTDTSWATVGAAHRGDLPRTRRQRRLLTELVTLSRTDVWSAQSPTWLELTGVDSRRVWDLLCELRDLGLPCMTAGRQPGRVIVHDPVGGTLEVEAVDTGLRVTAGLAVADHPVPAGAVLLADDTAIAWWQRRDLHLAAVPPTLRAHAAAWRGPVPVRIPSRDADEFTTRFLPRLPAGVTVRHTGAEPPPAAVRLRVTVTALDDFSLEVRWSWRRDPAAPRRPDAENALVDAVHSAVPDGALPAGARPGDLPSFTGLPPAVRLTGPAAARFTERALPVLRDLPDVEVEVVGELARYRPAPGPPVLHFEALRPVDRDWYDLAVTVRVDGEEVLFGALFTALATGRTHLTLPSGRYLPLRTGDFADLIELIEQSRALVERPEHTLAVSRYDTVTWDVLARLGVLDARAQQWRARAHAVLRAPDLPPPGLPAGLATTLRPYQQAGFGWLARLWEHGLGGVLADDLGLGKTVQTLALLQHVREAATPGRPFLVLAPTSVVPVWQGEAARFTPGLRVVVVSATPRSGEPDVAALAAGADVVVTSYALFRIGFGQYRDVAWAGLVLDEAQQVKNPAAVGYGCVRDLAAPWVLAVTGTPVENSLTDLWALMSLVAPGLLPTDPRVFDEVYRLPIERARDGARLQRLRERVAPLLLRRTKQQVAPELPARTEQVLEVELAPAHRAAYQALLARERTKVLGLMDDLPRHRFRILRSLTLLRQAALDTALVDPDLPPVPAVKLDLLVDLVTELVGQDHRVLVFSQFTRFLGAARDRLTAAGHASCYLDGATRRRADVVQQFRSGTAPVFLISLKAGGTGLTLTEADYCVLLDPWWNPATETQAVNRAHRIGQTRPVTVYRLVARDTIEEKVIALGRAKAALAASLLDGSDLGSAALTADDIRALVG